MNWKILAPYAGLLLVGLIIGFALAKVSGVEGFVDITQSTCGECGKPRHECGCKGGAPKIGKCPTCREIDWSKYVLKSSIPPCPPQPDMSRYMLKTECPAPPDMSKYVLKSAVPACPPCISTCNKPCKIGDCPPCPRPRCPVITCPEQKACPPCAAVEPPRCPDPVVSCSANYQEEQPWLVRPLLASISGM